CSSSVFSSKIRATYAIFSFWFDDLAISFSLLKIHVPDIFIISQPPLVFNVFPLSAKNAEAPGSSLPEPPGVFSFSCVSCEQHHDV
ncbi:MAG: hypothetical protein ACI4LJ_04670, partial [Anaerovoracaceae bacterium]